MDMIEKLVGEIEVEMLRKDKWIKRYGELEYRFETLREALVKIRYASAFEEHRIKHIARMALEE
jgi:hypothetical protein